MVNNPPIDQNAALNHITSLLNRIEQIQPQNQLLFQQVVGLMSPTITSLNDSPLILAVQMNMEDVVRFIVSNNAFRNLQGAMECIGRAFELAQTQQNQNQNIINVLEEGMWF